MRKFYIKLAVLLILVCELSTHSLAQVSVSKVDNNYPVTSNTGFYYSLPQTVLKIDIVFEKVQQLVGPLSSYTNEYLGITDYISSNKTEYNLLNVEISSFQESDPNQLYYVQFPAERSKDAKSNIFFLSKTGSLIAYNSQAPIANATSQKVTDQTYIFNEGDDSFSYMSQYNKRKKTDTIVRTINIDTVTINRFLYRTTWVDKNESDKAKDAALQIEKIRESRYNLISGYQEVNYGSSIIYMDQQLQKMEDEYLELFVGQSIKSIESRTIYFIPNRGNKNAELLRFSDGKSVVINVDMNGQQSKVSELPATSLNSIYYRIPSSANISVTSANINYFTGRFVINQFGIVTTTPLDNSKLQFDGKTGNLINIVKE